jgi:hypothetical protein
MRRILALALSAALLGVAGCSFDGGGLERARHTFGTADPTPEAFRVCGSHGCQKRLDVSLSAREWAAARAPFHPRPRTAGAERRALVESLRRLEVMVGEKTGYTTDKAFSVVQLTGKSQDCVDEMVNTAVYLAMLDDARELRFHTQGQRVSVGFMTRRFWTHTVASIIQKDSGQEFIIDTWAVAFGETPYVMDRNDWAANAPLRRDF